MRMAKNNKYRHYIRRSIYTQGFKLTLPLCRLGMVTMIDTLTITRGC